MYLRYGDQFLGLRPAAEQDRDPPDCYELFVFDPDEIREEIGCTGAGSSAAAQRGRG